jgi:hypothetical protein
MEARAVGVRLTGLPERTSRLREILLHGCFVAPLLCHMLTQNFADKSRDACVSLGCADPGPSRYIFRDDNCDVSHATNLVLHDVRVNHIFVIAN